MLDSSNVIGVSRNTGRQTETVKERCDYPARLVAGKRITVGINIVVTNTNKIGM